jgi:hypothetical protein
MNYLVGFRLFLPQSSFLIVLFFSNFESFYIVALPIAGITPSGDILAVL